MKTNNEKWQGSSKGKSTTGAGRDGKPFEKRDVKSILKGSRGAAKFGSDKPSSGGADYKKRDDSRPAYGDRKPYGSSDAKPAYGDRKPYENRDAQPTGDRRKFELKDGGRAAYGDRKPYESRDARPSFGDRKPYVGGGDKPAYGDRKPAFGSGDSRPAYGDRKPYVGGGDKPAYGDRKPAFGDKKPWENRDSKPAYGDRKPAYGDAKPAYGDRKPAYGDRKPAYGDAKPAYGDRKPFGGRDSKPSFGPRKPFDKDARQDNLDSNGEKIYGRPQFSSSDEPTGAKLAFQKLPEGTRSEYKETRYDNKKDGVTFRKRSDDGYDPNAKYSNKKQLEYKKVMADLTQPLRLNKFLANAGICSRREADEYIKAGVISVNGQIVTEMGVKVLHTDKVMFHEQTVQSEKKVYLLLNKPKDCVTTTEDTHERLTVLDLVKNACSERIYPVGRLDRNTTGVLLLTNDGDLASKLTHPKYDKKKIYHVALDKALEEADYNTILAGVSLDDEMIAADALEFVKQGDLKQVGIEIHSGQNRVVRRIFEKLGYKVIRLDRVFFAGLTKKSLPRGKYRFLNEREVNMLKMGAHA
ncbi:MAG: pseudouridine synthase [Paludibacter sp.]